MKQRVGFVLVSLVLLAGFAISTLACEDDGVGHDRAGLSIDWNQAISGNENPYASRLPQDNPYKAGRSDDDPYGSWAGEDGYEDDASEGDWEDFWDDLEDADPEDWQDILEDWEDMFDYNIIACAMSGGFPCLDACCDEMCNMNGYCD